MIVSNEHSKVMIEYWHLVNGDTYAVEVVGNNAIGVCGPLHYSEVTEDNRQNHNFEFNDEDNEWIMEQEVVKVT